MFKNNFENSKIISVIVPVFNVQKYLNKCIDSICNQTYSNLEIILVDDGSTDDSGKICDEYAGMDKRIKVIHKSNGGLSDARNEGLDIASGEFIAFVDSDDYIHKDMYGILLKNLLQTESDMSIAGFENIYEDSICVETLEEEELEVYENNFILSRLWEDDVKTTVAWNKLYKRCIFESLRFPVGRYHEDTFVIHKILMKCKRIVYTNQSLYYYLQRQGSIMNRVSETRINDVIDALEDRIHFFASNGKVIESNRTKEMILAELLYLSELQMKAGQIDIVRTIHRKYRKLYKKYYKFINHKKYFYFFLDYRIYMKYSKIK